MKPTGPAYIYKAKLHRVIDGDTYELMVDLGFRVMSRLTVRLNGYSCPELREPKGKEAARSVIVWRHGRKHIRPRDAPKRLRDILAGDHVVFRGKDEVVISVEVYR